jgi:hypothetical protein
MEHVTASHLRLVWDRNDWLCKGHHDFRTGYSCENQVISVCQELADSLDNGVGLDAIIKDFSKAFDSVPRRLFKKTAASGVELRVVVG